MDVRAGSIERGAEEGVGRRGELQVRGCGCDECALDDGGVYGGGRDGGGAELGAASGAYYAPYGRSVGVGVLCAERGEGR